MDGFYGWGRDNARLDFLGLSEHDIWLDDHESRSTQKALRRYTEAGRAANQCNEVVSQRHKTANECLWAFAR